MSKIVHASGMMIVDSIQFPKDPIFVNIGGYHSNISKCHSCNEEKMIVFSYGKENVLKRDICEYCWLAGVDKQFGINSDAKTLEALYKKE